MAFQLAEAYVDVPARLGSLDRGLSEAKSRIRRFQEASGRLARRAGMATAAIGTALGGAFYYFTKAASTAVETENRFHATFKEHAPAYRAWAEEYAEATGFAATSVQSWLAYLQDTFVPLGISRDLSAKLSRQLVTLAGDVASFKDVDPDKVIQDFTSAISGAHRAVRSYGIRITQALMETYAYNEGIAEQGAELTETQKVMARYGIIMEATQDAQGDLARTAGTVANRARRMRGQYSAFREAIGRAFLPVAADLLTFGADVVKSWREWAEANERLIRGVLLAGGALVAFTGSVAVAAGIVWGLTTAFTTLHAVALGIPSVLKTVSGAIVTLGSVALGTSVSLGSLSGILSAGTLTSALASLKGALAGAAGALGAFAAGLGVLLALPIIAGGVWTFADAVTDADLGIIEWAESIEWIDGLITELTAGAQRAAGAIRGAFASLIPGGKDFSDYMEEAEERARATWQIYRDNRRAAAREAKRAGEEESEASKKAAGLMRKAIEKAAKYQEDVFQDVAAQSKEMTDKMIAQQEEVQQASQNAASSIERDQEEIRSSFRRTQEQEAQLVGAYESALRRRLGFLPGTIATEVERHPGAVRNQTQEEQLKIQGEQLARLERIDRNIEESRGEPGGKYGP